MCHTWFNQGSSYCSHGIASKVTNQVCLKSASSAVVESEPWSVMPRLVCGWTLADVFSQCSPPHYSNVQPPSLICTQGKCLQTDMDDTEQREKISCICAGLIWVWTKILGQLVSMLWSNVLLNPGFLCHETVILCFKVHSCTVPPRFS